MIESQIIEVWEAYQPDGQKAVASKSKVIAEQKAIELFGGYDLVSKSKVSLCSEEIKELESQGWVM